MLELPELSDDRVTLRGWHDDDAAALRPACGDAAICRFTTVPLSYSLAEARAWIGRQRAHAADGSAVILAIVPHEHGEPVGMVGLFGLSEPEPTARFGYWLMADWRGRGLAGAATALLAPWGFTDLGLEAIHIDREAGNTASARVAEQLGAVPNGSRSVVYGGAELELTRHTLVAPGA
jgi:RimJ/RimL family protein N-acetyltransferase